MTKDNSFSLLAIHPEVKLALAEKKPVVALESTVISHGLPWPQNLETAKELEQILRAKGVIPATLALMDGRVKVGLSAHELERLAGEKSVEKVSVRDLGRVLSAKSLGATTVAATLRLSRLAGIEVFATGGLGGVHRGVSTSWDISCDLRELAHSSVLCVCAGVKSILDIPKTLEVLESYGVPVLTWQASTFPAFYCRESGVASPYTIQDLNEVAGAFRAQRELGLQQGLVLAVPITESAGLDPNEMDALIEQALMKAEVRGITGKAITPFLLGELVATSGGETLAANISLLRQNAEIAAELSLALRREPG